MIIKKRNSINTVKPVKPFKQINGFEIIKEIQEGTYGIVSLARHIATGKQVVIKAIWSDLTNIGKNEVEANLKLQHCEYITKMLTYFKDDIDRYCLVFEFSKIGDLYNFMKNNKLGLQFNLNFTKKVIRDVALGLKCCHENRICHRDIKSENILLFSGADNKVRFKLCDLGLMSYSNDKITGSMGTSNFMAPDMNHKKPYFCDKTDMWSLGILTYYIFFFEFPYEGIFKQAYASKIRSKIKVIKNDSMRDFISHLLDINQEKRLTVFQVLEHPFLKK